MQSHKPSSLFGSLYRRRGRHLRIKITHYLKILRIQLKISWVLLSMLTELIEAHSEVQYVLSQIDCKISILEILHYYNTIILYYYYNRNNFVISFLYIRSINC